MVWYAFDDVFTTDCAWHGWMVCVSVVWDKIWEKAVVVKKEALSERLSGSKKNGTDVPSGTQNGGFGTNLSYCLYTVKASSSNKTD